MPCYGHTGEESSPLAGSAITSAYDALGRLSSRTVAGAGAETFAYDAIGRFVTHASDLGSFTLSYLGQTGQITSRALASSTLATTWSYLTNADDRRLSGINNVGLTAGQFSTFAYTTTPENFIGGISETSDATAVYPVTGTQTATYNNLNQLANLSGQTLTFDAVGNVTSDGQRTYSWDAENRLVGIAYPGVSGKATAFAYDGLGRRVSIASTPPGGGSATTTSYLWCGNVLCQARNASSATIRSYYGEGELVPGTPNQPYYYGIDQIGSVRRAFASTSSAPAYGYDAYGVPLQATAPVTDFVYGGMFYNADSGLYLTNYRAYDPVAGRWLSRDIMGEFTDAFGNLYGYAGDDPVNRIDPWGLADIPSPANIPGGPWSPANQRPGSFYGPAQPKGPRAQCQWVPPEGQGGPPGSQGYWKTQEGGSGTWQRYDQRGVPITPEEAHPGSSPGNPIPPFLRRAGPIGIFFGVLLDPSPAY